MASETFLEAGAAYILKLDERPTPRAITLPSWGIVVRGNINRNLALILGIISYCTKSVHWFFPECSAWEASRSQLGRYECIEDDLDEHLHGVVNPSFQLKSRTGQWKKVTAPRYLMLHPTPQLTQIPGHCANPIPGPSRSSRRPFFQTNDCRIQDRL